MNNFTLQIRSTTYQIIQYNHSDQLICQHITISLESWVKPECTLARLSYTLRAVLPTLHIITQRGRFIKQPSDRHPQTSVSPGLGWLHHQCRCYVREIVPWD